MNIHNITSSDWHQYVLFGCMYMLACISGGAVRQYLHKLNVVGSILGSANFFRFFFFV